MVLNPNQESQNKPMQHRETNLKKLSEQSFDVLIVGGGINGAVSAAALSQKGIKTALIDQGDFAGMTSQESSNLAWGGIKYLENLEFLARHIEEPFGDSSALPLLSLCRMTKKQVTVALAGDGGDELGVGYPRYLWDRRADWCGHTAKTA